ncbi:unnamed protein product [Blepharisma stoltei]|uniref:Ran GTPase-activating protein n=1 Tax=Blepharisma stoltei TaxID=1481888 RepID=A0AAU9JVC3_9CILI|nr:unnamed protein product [Blepharisma stoltei]
MEHIHQNKNMHFLKVFYSVSINPIYFNCLHNKTMGSVCGASKGRSQSVKPSPKVPDSHERITFISANNTELSDLQSYFIAQQGMNRKIKTLYEAVFAHEDQQIFTIDLKFIDLCANHSHLANILPSFVNLNSLNLWKARLGVEGIKDLAKPIQTLSKLRYLSLADNNLGPEGIQYLCTAFAKLESLQTLELHINGLGPRGAEILGKDLPKLLKLNTISLTENEIGPDGIKFLIAAFVTMPNLQTIFLSQNAIGDAGGKCFLDSIQKLQHIKTLSLEGNDISGDMIEDLVEESPSINFKF